MTFNTLKDVAKFYKNYSKADGFSTRIRSTNKKGNEIKNQLITYSREEKWKSKIYSTEKTNPSVGLNCPARIYIHILNDIGVWIISNVVLHHSHPCCPNQADIFKQHRELSMSVRRTIENNEEADIRPSKTYQSFVAAAGGHGELNFIEKDVRNYITREVRNISELNDAKEFGKYLLRIKEKNQNFFFELEIEDDQLIKFAFRADARSRTTYEYFGGVISFDTTYNTNRYNQQVCGYIRLGSSPKFKELTAILHRAYDNVVVEMQEPKVKRKGTRSLSHEDANLESISELQSLPNVRTRGHPKNKLGS
ncbi:hypothetical protein Ahy_A07g037282 [Arachis hypogaea]|uniref:FAR1 domain-containing protein n=1 Tax=Arachis hypogaea TaxID=3818 RepID=A0A445CIA4_ARAHY|nr:hypothetical protein Ahy_A07g037282 [Arachis hypogaea]